MDNLIPAPDPDPNLDPDHAAPDPNAHSNRIFNSSFAIQNVRSLNISTKNDITLQKIISVCNLKTDFIFLSDLRLNSIKQISATNDIAKKFFFKGYKLFHNSPGPSRGTGILISKRITDSNFTILSEISDPDGNYLLMQVKLNNFKFILGSVYGPNHDDEIQFFDRLDSELRNLSDPFIIGGDWNATLDLSRVNSNIDVINMHSIPSYRRSLAINDLCNSYNLVDPFRCLYPNKKDYTFIPSSRFSTNRSRLDFFLISHQLTTLQLDCTIPHSLTSVLFDHKPVKLYFSRKKIHRKEVIKDIILKQPDLPNQVRFAVYECYLTHHDPDPALAGNINPNTIQEFLECLGRIGANYRDIHLMEMTQIEGGLDPDGDLEIAAKRTEISMLFEDLPGLEFFENLPCSANPENFFQALASCIKNRCLSYQSQIFKKRSARKKHLIDRISNLKVNFDQNSVQILNTERLLSDVVEHELKEELSLYKNFECLNNEKITPYFMSLVKNASKEDNLNNICNEGGLEFENDGDRTSYISNFFKKIYKKTTNAPDISVEDLKNFLGPAAEHPIVKNAKLNEEEKLTLESDISTDELTKSINEANMSSAPGADGISNRFIKRFWEFFKKPLLNLCNFCYAKGELPICFRSANIKLIPKKGDCKEIKNWRPISLLNCFYKIISRVFTTRLKKFMDKMTPICQKGYSNTRYCQEVLISVIEGIEKCNTKKLKGAALSLDIKKAFDSLSHSYLEATFKFYNFGPKLIKWLKMLSTNRKACIKINNAVSTDFFDLERGNAQGDTISPFLFNLGYQILLFKLDLSLQIAGIINEQQPGGVGQQYGEVQEVDPQVLNHDPKTYAMADDCTMLIKFESNNLISIMSILADFERISGLGCNVEKTILMQIGVKDQVPREILDLGLDIKNELTLLGVKIKNNGLCYDQNINLIMEKVRKQVNFWTRLNLSLPGRVNVAKTFMYSQVNYMGCFIPFPKNSLNGVSDLIGGYVRGKLKISNLRLFSEKNAGGLGLFDLAEFLHAQACSWIKRATLGNELWKSELKRAGFGDVYNIRKHRLDKRTNPILYYIAECYEKLIFKYGTIAENYKEMNLFENPLFRFDGANGKSLTVDFFPDGVFERFRDVITQIKFRELLDVNYLMISHQTLLARTGINLTELKYNKLRGLVNSCQVKYRKLEEKEKTSRSIQHFFSKIKKGSKKIRKIISLKNNEEISPNMLKFAEITDTIVNLDSSRRLNAVWDFSAFDNTMKTFIFKFHNNQLGINSRVAHFVRGHNRNCTFCTINRIEEDNSESITHLFFDCTITENLLENFYAKVFNLPYRMATRTEFFVGFENVVESEKKLLDLLTFLAKKFIWDSKVRFTIPTIENLLIFVNSEMARIVKCNRNVSHYVNNSNFLANNRNFHF